MMPFGDNSFRSGAGDALSHANRSDFDSDEEEERMLDAAIFDEEHVTARGAHRARRESIEADMGRMFPAGPSPGAPAQTELRMVSVYMHKEREHPCLSVKCSDQLRLA